MAEGGLLERLVITEEGDEVDGGVTERRAESSSVVITQSCCSGESSLKKEEEHTGEDEGRDVTAAEMSSEEEQGPERKQQTKAAEDEQAGEAAAAAVVKSEEDKQEDDEPAETENINDGQKSGDNEVEGQTHEGINKKTEEHSDKEDDKVTQSDPQVDTESLNPSGGTKSQEEDPNTAHRLTPDFPEALYELLCTLQEGRRLNDQRCSFRMESGVRRRRCHSEPNTTKPAHRVVFSSMTSLQKEEFFDLVATSQARRLDDQRAQLERSTPPKSKARSFRGSIKQLSFVRRPTPTPASVPVPVPVPKEDLYNMILTTQAQGRLEDQRSRAPGPMDDEDFFSLLLRVQGGRMDEQRTELPCLLQT